MSWDKIPGWFSWEEVYARWAREAPPGAVFVEVGVFLGRSLAFLLEHLRGKDATVYAVDPWVDDWRPEEWRDGVPGEGHHYTWGGDLREVSNAHGGPFRSALWHLMAHAGEDFEKVRVLRVPSVQAARLFEPGSVDFVWIDGDHNEGAIRQDIAVWTPLVKPGGAIGGHDYSESYPGVVRAVDEAFGPGRGVRVSSWEVRR